MSGTTPIYQRQQRTQGGGGVVSMPTPQLAPLRIESPGTSNALGQALASLGQTLGGIAEQEIQKEQQQAVFSADEEARTLPIRDGAGNLIVPKQRDPLTRQGRVFNAGIVQRVTAEIANSAGMDAVRLRAETPNDPTAFLQRWQGRTDGVLQSVPAWLQPEARSTLERLGGEHARGVATEAMQNERRNQAEATQLRRQNLERDLDGLAAAGVTSGPEWERAFGTYNAHLNDMVTTGQIARAGADEIRSNITERTMGAAAVRQSQDMVRSGRPRDEVLREFDASMDAQRMPLAQRERLRNVVEAGLNEQEALRREARTEATIAAEDWQQRITNGVPVPAEEGIRLAAELDRAGATRMAQRVRDVQAVQQDAQVFRSLPTAELARKAQETAQRVLRPEASARDVQLADMTSRMLARRVEAMNADPFATGAAVHRAAVGEVRPLDFSNPVALREGFQQRERQAQQIGLREGRPVPALTAGEVAGMRTMLAEGTIDQQQALLAGLSGGLAPTTMARTLNMLVEGQDNAPRLQAFVVAAANATSRPSLAREILQGMEVRRQLNPAAVSSPTARNEIIAALTPMLESRPDTLRQVTESVLALYAQRHIAGGTTSTEDVRRVDAARLPALIEEIMPTVVANTNWMGRGGQRIPVPRPGMTQTQFDEHMARMPPEALAGARAADGRPFTPQMLRGARMVPVDEGVVELRYNGFNVLDGQGRSFRLNLRDEWPQRLGAVAPRQRSDSEFQQEFAAAAERVSARIGVPARTILAHWSLETNNGRAFAGRNNLGNMTALAGQDATEGGDRDAQGNPIRQRFRNFASLDEFADNYASWVERRAPAALNMSDPQAYAAALSRANYATDPRFPQSLAGVARRFQGGG